jgi:hypothetical protein
MSDGSTLRVKQGIPGGAFVRERIDGKWVELPLVKVVNGVTYNVSDPAYNVAIERAAAGPAAAAMRATRGGTTLVVNTAGAIVRDHRTGITTSTTPGSASPAGTPATSISTATKGSPIGIVGGIRAQGSSTARKLQ